MMCPRHYQCPSRSWQDGASAERMLMEEMHAAWEVPRMHRRSSRFCSTFHTRILYVRSWCCYTFQISLVPGQLILQQQWQLLFSHQKLVSMHQVEEGDCDCDCENIRMLHPNVGLLSLTWAADFAAAVAAFVFSSTGASANAASSRSTGNATSASL